MDNRAMMPPVESFFRWLALRDPVPEAASRPYLGLARYLEALASETRLELLHALRTPKALHEIRVAPSLERAGTSPERPLTRQAVTRHLDQLEEQGLVHRIAPSAQSSGELYVINHERLFALVDELRGLSRLRPALTSAALAGATIDAGAERSPDLPARPRVVVVYGRDEGSGLALQGPTGTSWRIGRAPNSELRLDYDPFLSSTHATIERTSTGFLLRDAGSRNGTAVNWKPLAKNGAQQLEAGDILHVGRSLLVFHR